MTEKKKGGRPTKYDPSMCKTVIELMSEGASLCEVAAELGICRDTLNEWKKNIPEISDALKKGVQLSEAWWLGKGRKNLENPKFNYTGWYMNMKNRFGWTDKHQVETAHRIYRVEGVSDKFLSEARRKDRPEVQSIPSEVH